ncbi:unnamed protein product [Didymodactylos carnosus]|uniref:NHL repeat-containing protein n=1 Tax=Didymodactylos carnosus TaxID=1234261 RepID=A0A8S2FSC6_9BILA|nr:unnamed protein product [Didymodactylos carnosus]CAF4339977.1 unnamed protein product [Didymodactylos carnosus]
MKYPPGSDPSTGGIVIAGGHGPGGAANQLNTPSGIFVDCAGTVYIADRLNNRIQRWSVNSTTGVTVAGSSSGVSGNDSMHLNTPLDVQFDNTGNMYIADHNNNRIQKWLPFASSGTTVAGNGTHGSSFNEVTPVMMFVDSYMNIFVVDNSNNRILKFSSGVINSTVLLTLAGAEGLAIDNNYNLYVPSGTAVRKYSFIPS